MNKTVTINLSGTIFHIDEDAYQKLSNYLNTIRGYFSESEGRDEIMADIENRIAEMLSARISDRKQAVLISDIDYIIGIMGKPEDFADEKTQNENSFAGSKTRTHYNRRRVFRDPDNKILGGVCSGIANYFNFDPLWLRLTLVILTIFGFGTGVVLYIVLWIIIPEAKTIAEKLEMHGEEVNFSNIGKKVEEEIQQFGKRMENWKKEVKKSGTGKNAADFIRKFLDFIGTVFGEFLRVFTKLFGVFLVIIGLIILVSIISSILGKNTILFQNDDFSYSVTDIFNTFFQNEYQQFIAGLAILLLIGIPMLMLVYGGFRLIFGIKQSNRFLTTGAGILWFIGLALAIFSGINISNHFAEEATNQQMFPMKNPKCDTLFLRVKDINDWNYTRSQRHRKRTNFFFCKPNLIAADSSTIYFGFPTLDIVRGDADSIEIIIFNDARGADRKEALYYARNISYEIFQNDSLIEFMPYYTISKDKKWRAQRVHVEMRLPKGKVVYLNKSMRHIIYDIRNESDTWDGDMVGRRWQMGEEKLKCIDCDGLGREKRKRWNKNV